MTIIQKLQATFLDWRSALFGKPVVRTIEELAAQEAAARARFAAHVDRINEAQRRNEKLASLARYIEGATVVVAKRKAQKKRHSDVLETIKLAQNDRLMIETGRMVYDPAFGAWVVKGEK